MESYLSRNDTWKARYLQQDCLLTDTVHAHTELKGLVNVSIPREPVRRSYARLMPSREQVTNFSMTQEQNHRETLKNHGYGSFNGSQLRYRYRYPACDNVQRCFQYFQSIATRKTPRPEELDPMGVTT